MAKCVRCGARYPDSKYMCEKCGAPLAYEPEPRKGPSFWQSIGRYKNWLILVALAVLLAAIQVTAGVVGAVNWVIFIGMAIVVLILYLRARSGRATATGPGTSRGYGPPSGFGSDSGRSGGFGRGSGPSRGQAPGSTRGSNVTQPGPARAVPKEKKHHNVIPFRKKK